MPTITINFKHSKSHSGEQTLYEVAGLTAVKQETDDQSTRFTVRLTKNKIRHAFGFLKSLNRLKHKQIFVDDELTDYDTTFNFLPCYQRRLNLGSPKLYCFGNFEEFADHNIFGCTHSSFFNLGSIKYGRWDQNRFKWLFNKRAIKKGLMKELEGVRCCPAFNEKRVDRIIAGLPKAVNPYVDKGWRPIPLELLDTPESTNCAQVIKPSGITYFIKGVHLSGEEAIHDIAKRSRLRLFDKGLEWFSISVNLLENGE